MRNNPLLLQTWGTPYELPPFADIQPEHFEPAFDVLLPAHLAEIDAIAANTEAPTFANTVVAFADSGALLSRASRIFGNLIGSVGSPDLQVLERKFAPRLAAHQSKVHLHAALFARIDAVYRDRDGLNLDEEDSRLLLRIHQQFVRAGATLHGEARSRYAAIVSRLATLYTEFSQNILADENDYTLPLAADDLDGLPADLREGAATAARLRGLAGHVIPLARGMVIGFMTFSTRRELRRTLWLAWEGRGENIARDNRPLAAEILALRQEQAQLLGFAHYADYALDDRMAGTPAAVHALMEQVWEPAKASFAREKAMLVAEAERLGLPTDVQLWDWFFLAEKVRVSQYALDDAEIKPYFSLDNMIAAMFDVAGRLFGLSFAERRDTALYHADVRLWEVRRDGEVIGLFIGDNFARQGKRGGAWMSVFRLQSRTDGQRVLPVVINNNNFTQAANGATLLSFNEVRTLFHEFGHGLHGLLSDVRYSALACTQVPRDYVELPSQLLENWALVPDILAKHARHAETGAPIPAELVARIQAASTFNQGFETVRYSASTLIDMALHQADASQGIDIAAFEAAECTRLGVPPEAGMNHRPAHFRHIFASDGYAAGYYVYMWAEVLEAEAFAAFEESGDVFNPALAARLHEQIYSAGNAREQKAAFRTFRGRDPQAQAMLGKRGLL